MSPYIKFGKPWFLLVLLLNLAACDQFSPNNYEDCILRNLKGSSNDLAAAQIMASCRAKFPAHLSHSTSIRDLNSTEYQRLTGRANTTPTSPRLSGNLYNGNSEITITKVKIRLLTKVKDTDVERVYSVDTLIPPLSARAFSIEVISGDNGTDFNWQIASAAGIPK